MKITANFSKIVAMTCVMLFCLGFSSVVLLEAQYAAGLLSNGSSYMGPAFDSEGIMTGIYLACFLAPIILYLLPYLIGVNIVITKRNIYSSNAKKGILGLEVGVIGGVLLLILEIVTISYSDGFKLDLSFLYFPLGYTIISSALFIIIPRFFKV